MKKETGITLPEATKKEKELLELLAEARNQIEYMNQKFVETGTANMMIARINNTLHKYGEK